MGFEIIPTPTRDLLWHKGVVKRTKWAAPPQSKCCFRFLR